MATYYQPSGKSSAAGIPMLLIGGLIAAAILGAIYGYATFHIPFIYISFLLTIGFAFGMGWVINQITEVGKIRNPSAITWGSIALGIAALFFGWVAWLHAAMGVLFINPADVLGAQQLLGQTGVWSIGSMAPTGMTLYAFWAVEAAIVIIGTWMFSQNQVHEPFCEPCESWLNPSSQISDLSIPLNPKDLIKSIELGQVDELMKLTKTDHNGASARISLKDCPSCEKTTLMDLSIVTIKVDSDGKAEEEVTHLMQNFVLSPENFATLNAHVWEASKEENTGEA